jgi:excisionase family DNA binding protein
MENYWRVREVAAALQISAQTVYRYVANGEIPYHKLNRSVRFKPSEIERWIESKLAGIPPTLSENFSESVTESHEPKEAEHDGFSTK